MENPKVFKNNSLTIEVEESDAFINVRWTGVSIERDPAKSITPILVDVVRSGSNSDKRIKLDFRGLSYMNSSTITPVIKILERAKRGTTHIEIIYKKSLKWQDLIFSALEIFQTQDQRVRINGL